MTSLIPVKISWINPIDVTVGRRVASVTLLFERTVLMEKLIKDINMMKRYIPQNTYRTLMGQIKAGDVNGATVGVERLKRRYLQKESRGAV